jgi:hypothetical protein
MMRSLRQLLMMAVLIAACPAGAFGQAAWEYTPYDARLLVALEPSPQLPTSLVATLGEAVPARTNAVWGSVLQMQVAAAQGKLKSALVHDLDHLTAELVAAEVERQELEADKLFVASLAYRDGKPLIRVRELDCRSRQLGPVVERSCTTIAELGLALGDALAESFTPLARIEQVEEKKIVARLRAGGLIVDPASPALAEPGMVLRPVIRRNDRTGQPAKGGIQAIGWSFLNIDERRDSILQCTLLSGYRAAIPARGGVRIERLALLVKPRHEATRLVLRSRSDESKTLAGYEIHRRNFGAEETELLGVTDSQGSFVVPRGDGSLETLVVKSGKQPLARLPLVPGYAETLTAQIIDDDARLAAEGFVAALSSRVLDLVAQREILAAQIRGRVKEGKGDEAQKLLDEFRRLDTRADLGRELDRFRQQVSTGDRVTQGRIDRVFADAQRLLLLKPLSDDLLAQLTREVSAIRTGGE